MLCIFIGILFADLGRFFRVFGFGKLEWIWGDG